MTSGEPSSCVQLPPYQVCFLNTTLALWVHSSWLFLRAIVAQYLSTCWVAPTWNSHAVALCLLDLVLLIHDFNIRTLPRTRRPIDVKQKYVQQRVLWLSLICGSVCCFVSLNRYRGIISVPGFHHEWANGDAPIIENRWHPSSPWFPLDNLECPDTPHPPP